MVSNLSAVCVCQILRLACPDFLALWVGNSEQVRPAHLNVLIVCVRVRDGLKSYVLVADFCGQVDNLLHLFHNLGNPLALQVNLSVKRPAKVVISRLLF